MVLVASSVRKASPLWVRTASFANPHPSDTSICLGRRSPGLRTSRECMRVAISRTRRTKGRPSRWRAPSDSSRYAQRLPKSAFVAPPEGNEVSRQSPEISRRLTPVSQWFATRSPTSATATRTSDARCRSSPSRSASCAGSRCARSRTRLLTGSRGAPSGPVVPGLVERLDGFTWPGRGTDDLAGLLLERPRRLPAASSRSRGSFSSAGRSRSILAQSTLLAWMVDDVPSPRLAIPCRKPDFRRQYEAS
jgi:hypothetical protein